jgi:acyl transferase domain-containing protein
LALWHAASPAVLHCRSLNHYVASALADWQRGASVGGAITRTTAQMPSPVDFRDATLVAGSSSFGMSGVNAHVLLARPGGEPIPHEPPKRYMPSSRGSWRHRFLAFKNGPTSMLDFVLET